MSLKNMDSDDLAKRLEMIMPDYLKRLAGLRQDLIKIDKLRKELLLIREELISRNIKVDDNMEENI